MSDSNQDSPYKICQTLQRGLELMQCFNSMTNTASRISELSKQTGLHRTTVKRLLETLRQSGFVKYDPVTGLYSLTYQVKSLSCGYRDTVEVVEVAWPVMKEISKQTVWPCSILIFDKDEMVVRSTTRPYSRLSFHSALPGRRMPVLKTAAGRAFLSFVSQQEQELILQLLKDKNDQYSLYAQDDEYIKKAINETQSRGYGINSGEWQDEPKFGAIAFPIVKDHEVIACLNCVYLLSAVKKLNNFQTLVDTLKTGKKQIEQLIN